jgi:hypothetical protein
MRGKGDRHALRHTLHMPAMVALRFNKTVAALGERLAAREMACFTRNTRQIVGSGNSSIKSLLTRVYFKAIPERNTPLFFRIATSFFSREFSLRMRLNSACSGETARRPASCASLPCS